MVTKESKYDITRLYLINFKILFIGQIARILQRVLVDATSTWTSTLAKPLLWLGEGTSFFISNWLSTALAGYYLQKTNRNAVNEVSERDARGPVMKAATYILPALAVHATGQYIRYLSNFTLAVGMYGIEPLTRESIDYMDYADEEIGIVLQAQVQKHMQTNLFMGFAFLGTMIAYHLTINAISYKMGEVVRDAITLYTSQPKTEYHDAREEPVLGKTIRDEKASTALTALSPKVVQSLITPRRTSSDGFVEILHSETQDSGIGLSRTGSCEGGILGRRVL